MGIEPTSETWEAPILPLNYTRSLFLIVLVNACGSRRPIHSSAWIGHLNKYSFDYE